MRRTLPTLLSALLLLSQLLLALHHVDLDAHSDGRQCDICFISHGLDHSVASSVISLPVVVQELPVFWVLLPAIRYSTPLAYRPRAPPHSLA